MRRIGIFDTTLRDGLKFPGAILSMGEKVRIAKQIARLRVEVLEVGFPAASREEFETVRRIVKEVRGPTICILARATNPKDFDIARDAVEGAERVRIHTFVPASRAYREHYLGKSADETVELGVAAVRMAGRFTSDVEFSLVDAFRADPEDVVRLVMAAVEAGAGTVNLADTTGCATPGDVSELFTNLRQRLDVFGEVALSIHCHNDLGLATANSFTALLQGAAQVHCTVNGIGERAGNAALEEIAAILHLRSAQLGAESGILLGRIFPTCRLVGRLTGSGIQPHKPIVGSGVFSFDAEIPQLSDSTGNPPFEILNREAFGIQPAGEVITFDADREELRDRLANLGYDVDGEPLEEFYTAFQNLAAKKEQLFDADIELLAEAGTAGEELHYRLIYLNATAGSISVPTATVQLEVGGRIFQDTGFGYGPVDAAFKTLGKLAGRHPKLVRYELSGVTPGTDAQGEVTVRLEENGRVVNGRAADTDIVLASAKAFVDGLNKLESLHAKDRVFEFTSEESRLPRT